MRQGRHIAVASLGVVALGSLLTTGGYAWYLRSDRYRSYCAAVLTESLGLPGEIGRVVPRSLRAREFRAVRVWLPERRGEAAYCERAVLIDRPTAEDPDGYELTLRGGRSEISARTWLREDYRFVLESGLRPVFDPAGPRRVVFSGMDLAFRRNGFGARLHDASGEVSFLDRRLAQASAVCREFNGYVSGEPVGLQVQFSPQAGGIRLDRLELTVPELPIALVGLGALAGIDLRSGSFSGRLVYREYAPPDVQGATAQAGGVRADNRELRLSGKLYRLELAECTRSLLARPWRGSVPELELEELTLVNERAERLRFRGVFKSVVLGDVLAPWGLTELGGELLLRVRRAEVSATGIEHLIASGRCDDIALERVSAALGWGAMTGRARVLLEDLTICDNRLTSLDLQITVEPPTSGQNYVDRNVVSEVLRRTIGVPLPSFLPERFGYTQLGVRVEVRDEVLHVFGTHGPRGKAILSVGLGDQELPVILEPERAFDLREYLAGVRARLLAEFAERLRSVSPADAWRALSASETRTHEGTDGKSPSGSAGPGREQP